MRHLTHLGVCGVPVREVVRDTSHVAEARRLRLPALVEVQVEVQVQVLHDLVPHSGVEPLEHAVMCEKTCNGNKVRSQQRKVQVHGRRWPGEGDGSGKGSLKRGTNGACADSGFCTPGKINAKIGQAKTRRLLTRSGPSLAHRHK